MTDFNKGCCCLFELEFTEDEEMELDFGEITEVQHGYDPYEGPYEVTPLAYQDIILKTKDKNMTEDVTVKEIPIAEVSNPAGGLTLTIG